MIQEVEVKVPLIDRKVEHRWWWVGVGNDPLSNPAVFTSVFA